MSTLTKEIVDQFLTKISNENYKENEAVIDHNLPEIMDALNGATKFEAFLRDGVRTTSGPLAFGLAVATFGYQLAQYAQQQEDCDKASYQVA